MTEHAAVIFVFFFLAEYASIVLICILTSILFLGGYLLNFIPLLFLIECIDYYSYIASEAIFVFLDKLSLLFYSYNEGVPFDLLEETAYALSLLPDYYSYTTVLASYNERLYDYNESVLSDPSLEGMLYGLSLGLKTCIMIFVFIWARASFPRIRFDQLMSFCWTILLPLVIAFIILVPCILYSYDIIPSNVSLL